MKKLELQQLIKEEFIKVLNERETTNEGWKENILVGLASLAGSLGNGGLKAQDMARELPTQDKTEISVSMESPYDVLIGYLVNLDKAGGANKSPEQMGAIKEARMYLEALRDNKTPQSLSKAGKVALEYAVKETKNMGGSQLKDLATLGASTHTVSYN